MIKKCLRKATAFTMCSLLFLCMLSGCSNQTIQDNEAEAATPETVQSGESSNDTASSEPKTLNIAVGAELTTLYPLNMDEQNLVATRLCYESLVNYVDGEIVPWLAQSWETSEDGLTLTFHLREDVTFQDGTAFDAEAVKKNFESKQANPNFRAYPAVVNVTDIEVVDTYTVAFHYNTPFYGYLSDFSFREIMVCVSPEVIEEDNFQTMKGVVGTGPYIYDEVKSGEYVKFIRNDDYWGEPGVYDEIYVKYIPDASTRLMALQNGEIDVIYGNALITWDDYNQAISSQNVNGKISEADTRTVYFVVNAGNPMLKDKTVREAIAYGIDKDGICQGLTYGHVNPAYDMFPEGNFLSDIPMNITRKYDLEKAKALLDEAGWILNESTGLREKDGETLNFKVTYNSGDALNKLLSSTVKSQLKELGIDAVTEGQDMMTWWQEGVSGNYGMIIWGTEENTLPHINFPKMLNSSPHTPSLQALSDSQPVFDAIKEIQVTEDIRQATELYEMILNYTNDNVVEIPLYYTKDMILYNTDTVADYTFTDTPVMFEIDNLVPVN